jgi:hypothetical protein
MKRRKASSNYDTEQGKNHILSMALIGNITLIAVKEY